MAIAPTERLLQPRLIPGSRCLGAEEHPAHVVVDSDDVHAEAAEVAGGLGADEAGRPCDDREAHRSASPGAVGGRELVEQILEPRRDDLRAEVATGELQSGRASALELLVVGEDAAKRAWKPLRIGGVDHPAGTRLAHDPSDLGAGVDARQHGHAAGHQVHELRRQVELVDVGPLGDEPDGRPLHLVLELLEQQAGHLDAVGADLRRHLQGELAGPRQDQPDVIAEGRRALERAHQRRKVL